ncbi:MAG: ubiquinol-cytochrome c reductase iron-sulfur subunit [Pseudohaliea sp.]
MSTKASGDTTGRQAPDPGRRRFLTLATSAVAGVGAAGVAAPFIGYWSPSAKAKAAGAPVKADLSRLEPGAMVVIEWRGKPVYVVHRTRAMLDELPKVDPLLKDPASAMSKQPAYISGNARSLRPEFLIVEGLCTHLGCAPKFRPEVGAADLGGERWHGGFFCPCHGSKFDLAGRVYSGVPASTNLVIPPHSFEAGDILVIGVDTVKDDEMSA